jgi:hypothetical protein
MTKYAKQYFVWEIFITNSVRDLGNCFLQRVIQCLGGFVDLPEKGLQ